MRNEPKVKATEANEVNEGRSFAGNLRSEMKPGLSCFIRLFLRFLCLLL